MLTLIWFSRDLRLTDNPALAAAIARGGPIVPVFVLDDPDAGEWAPGGASRWWHGITPANSGDETLCGQHRPGERRQTSTGLCDIGSNLPRVPRPARTQESWL